MDLSVKTRTIFGKKVKSLRKNGLIPGEIFGKGQTNEHIEISEKDFRKIFKKAGEHTIVNAITEKGEKLPVLITYVHEDTLSGKILAVDLHKIRMDEKIQTKIPIEFTGLAPATKSGFVVVKVLEEIEIESLPDKIPQKFEVDLGSLENVGQGIYVKDLKSPEGVKILSPETMAVVTVTEKTKEEVEAPKPVTAEEATTESAEKGTEAGESKENS